MFVCVVFFFFFALFLQRMDDEVWKSFVVRTVNFGTFNSYCNTYLKFTRVAEVPEHVVCFVY